MCHAVPARVTRVLDGDLAEIDLGGARKTVSTVLVGPVIEGEFLLVHVGYALGRIDPDEAEATLAALAELDALEEARS
ncbi:HypC/HybG/HupF family hydrogenase formation chaperone [Roseibacterium beibuensis]|uniref:Hydrogenase expression/formation protein HypC n=1 Tax=[Roseibacterium] beibuensis TaxID=1193142 RepID=A0ABP9KYR0_9RHOB|nr:HypC/HybG/HupF family hydrogenase formation chaperone [Roseibacterium beibuensis]MCS6622018.1 HypC/HybG/HupF family hydrogenase formation chaperone [Roseibacterium beibuensis]